jgi:hypothetical protein
VDLYEQWQKGTAGPEKQQQGQPQIPSLRCGMTNKRTGNGKGNRRFLRFAVEWQTKE